MINTYNKKKFDFACGPCFKDNQTQQLKYTFLFQLKRSLIFCEHISINFVSENL